MAISNPFRIALLTCLFMSVVSAQTTLRVIGPDSQPVSSVYLWLTEDYPRFPIVDPETRHQSAKAYTDAQGQAVVQLPAGPTNIVAVAKGYAPLFLRGMDLSRQPVTEVRLSLGQTIRGQVSDDNKQPIAEAKITARRKDFPLDYMADFTPTTSTDAQGNFVIEHAAEGTYVLNVLPADGAAKISFDPVTVQVAAGAEPAAIALVAKPGVVFKGRYIASGNLSVAGKRVSLSIRLPETMRSEVRTEADGSFIVPGIPAGASGFLSFEGAQGYSLIITPAADQTYLKPAPVNALRLTNVPGGMHEGIEVKLLRDATVKGHISDVLGAPVPNVDVIVEQTSRIYRGNELGEFTATIPPGIDVTLRASRDRRIEPMPSPPIRAEEGQTVEQNLTVVVRPTLPHDGEISGKVVDADGQPVKGAKVYLANLMVLPEDIMIGGGARRGARGATPAASWTGGMFYPATTTTGDEGKFIFDKLDPGKTDIWAYDPAKGWAWMPMVVSKSTRDLTLKLAQAPEDNATISGVVVDPAGRPVSGARLSLFSGDATQVKLLAEATSDRDGKYTITAVPAWTSPQYHYFRLVCSSADQGIVWRSLPQSSLSNLQLQFKPQARLVGRVIDPSGKPVKGASVAIYTGDDPDFGRMQFYRATAEVAPSVLTTEDGSFELTRAPQGTTISLRTTHPEFAAAQSFTIRQVAALQPVDQVKLGEPIVIEGTVRRADTHQPMQGAIVSLGRDIDAITTIANAQGQYRFGNLDNVQFSMDNFVPIRAVSGEGISQLEGMVQYRSRLSNGDRVSGVDIELSRSFAALEAEWRQQPGMPANGSSLVAVLDDCDPAFADKAKYADTLTIYDSTGAVRGQYAGLNISQNVGPGHPMAVANDGSLWLTENTGNRLLKFSRDAKVLLEKPGLKITSIAVDPKTDNIWALTSEGTIGGKDLVVFNSSGEQIANYPQKGFDIVYSKHDDCFWITGQQLIKIDRAGKVLAQASMRFVWISVSLGINEKDGSVWVIEREHPQVAGSKDRLLIFEPDGKLRKEVEGASWCLLVDSSHDGAWTVNQRWGAQLGLTRLDLNGEASFTVPLTGSALACEPDTGYVWVANQNSVNRLDRAGKVVSTIKSPRESQKWAVSLP